MKIETRQKLAEVNAELINAGVEEYAEAIQAIQALLVKFPILSPERGTFTIFVDIDTDDDARIVFEGKNYCFYGDDLKVYRTFATVQECYDFLKNEIVIEPGFKVSDCLVEWIDDFIETHKRGEDWFGISGNQTVAIEIREN